MCRNAPRTFKSLLRPAISSHADTPLMTIPIKATTMTVTPATSAGMKKR